MNPNNCKRRSRRRRTRHLSIRIDEDVLYWLRKNQYSATAIFFEAIKELGFTRKRKD